MSNQSGIRADEVLKNAFTTFVEDSSAVCMKVIIDEAAAKFAQSGEILKSSGSFSSDLTAVQNFLEPKVPCYCLFRLDGIKFVTIFYMPENSKVRSKMIMASSTSTLKNDLDSAQFEKDWPISEIEECCEDVYKQFTADDSELVKSYEEKQEEETRMKEADGSTGEAVSAILGFPIKIAPETLTALEKIKSGEFNTLVLVLDPDAEVLNCEDPLNASVADFVFPEREPRYFVHIYKKDAKKCFIYYCPGLAKPKLKMFYSTVKSKVVQLFKQLEMGEFTNFECDSKADCTEQDIEDTLFPKAAVDTSFKKPSARGGRGKARVAKFSANK